ncbi:MAG: amidohydrolase family protein [Candidatus Lambdaproteobacteria bacterium]|nr:amidohydrolase family protein [Candidatus Lambdaproteobacteria bacterium]
MSVHSPTHSRQRLGLPPAVWVLAVALVAASSSPAAAQPTAATAGPAFAAALPLVDAHVHYSAAAWSQFPAHEVLGKLEAAGVRLALVSSSPDDGTLTLYGLDARRILPVLRPYREGVTSGNWMHDQATLAYLRERLARGIYGGLGEVHLGTAEEADTPVVRGVAALAAQRGLLLHVHADAPPIQAIFDHTPGVRILWGHAGMVTPPERVRAMLERHPRLWAELSFRESEVAAEPEGAAWRALLTDHADRFLVGSDTYANGRWAAYDGIISGHRRYLAQLPPEVARAIAYGNAVRLVGDHGVKFP